MVLRRSLEFDDGQVLLVVEVCDGQLKANTWIATGLGLGTGTTGVTGPSISRLPSRTLVGGRDASIGFVGSLAVQGRVRSVLVEPDSPPVDLLAKRALSQG